MIRINLAPEGKRRRGVGVSLPTFALPSLNLGTLFAVLYVVLVVGIAAYWWALSSQQARLTAEIAAGQTELEQLRVIIAKVNAEGPGHRPQEAAGGAGGAHEEPGEADRPGGHLRQ